MAIKEKKVTDMEVVEHKVYRCTKCGAVHENPVNKFYKSTWSQLWNDNDKYCSICKKCINELFDEYSRRYKSDQTALTIVCHYLDVPFYYSLYNSIIQKNSNFSVGMYLRQILNNKQYQYKTFVNTIIEPKELAMTETKFDEVVEQKWAKSDSKNKDFVIEILGNDPFEGFKENDRRYLFSEAIKYLDNDENVDDTYKLGQIIQIIINNNQIRNYDVLISTLDPIKDAKDIETLTGIKNKLVTNNDKIAKENEISVKNRSNKDAGKNTLTYLMRDLREKDFDKAEADYYDQLMGQGTMWANKMSINSIKENGMFDENDMQEIYETNLELVDDLYKQLDNALEKIRLLTKDNDSLRLELNNNG